MQQRDCPGLLAIAGTVSNNSGRLTAVEKNVCRCAHLVKVDTGEPLQAVLDAPGARVREFSRRLLSPEGEVSLSPNGLGPVKRRQE